MEFLTFIVEFQAHCRGHLFRTKLKAVQTEYEDIVRELEGSLDHLSWRGGVMPKPHFADPEENSIATYCYSKIQRQACPKTLDKVQKQNEKFPLCSKDLVPERDEEPSHSKNRRESDAPQEVKTDSEKTLKEGVSETDTILNFLDTSNTSIPNKGKEFNSVLTNTTHNPDILLQQRNALAMELLWIQQAIASRKKYLSLKEKMEAA